MEGGGGERGREGRENEVRKERDLEKDGREGEGGNEGRSDGWAGQKDAQQAGSSLAGRHFRFWLIGWLLADRLFSWVV